MTHTPPLFAQNENIADGYWCIYVGLLTNIVILPITSPRSHPFAIFRAKRLFGVWAFYNSALIRLQMENPTGCPSIIYFPLLAFKSCHNSYNYGHIICKTGEEKRLLLHTFDSMNWCISCCRSQAKWFIVTQRDDAPLISCLAESHILATVKVTSLLLISTWIDCMKPAGFVVWLLPGVSTSLCYKSLTCTKNLYLMQTYQNLLHHPSAL